jgi:Zn-dependent protease
MIHDEPLVDAIFFILILLPSVILHEVAHGYVAERLGDRTAREAGRITLNPLPHIDPVGSLAFPGLLALAGQPVWGWAKPVPIQPRFFRNPTGGMAITALAGPGTNLLLALLVARLGPFFDLGEELPAGVGRVWRYGDLPIGFESNTLWVRALFGLMVLNVALALFNMLPIPPLDGSRLVPLVLPPRARVTWMRISQYGLLILFALIFLFRDALSWMTDVIGTILQVLV